MPKTASKKKRVRLRLNLHPGQREVWESETRFRVVAAGRQFGKSRLGSAAAFERALSGQAVWWVAPDYPIATIGWKLLKSLAKQIPTVQIRESERLLAFPSGGWIQVKSAHSEGSLRGVTLDFLVVDEAAFIEAERWNSELRPTLAVKHGGALFLSTFAGENFFYDLYQRGQDPAAEEWESWRKPSVENPYFSEEELEEARRTTPRAEFEQEYEANPLVYAGAVFDGELVQRAIERPAEWRTDLPAYAGLDWGYSADTALEVCQEDSEGRVAWLMDCRWTATELAIRCEAIADICARRNVHMIATDAAGATENATLASTLARRGLRVTVQPVPFSKFKTAGISTRRWYLENGLEAIGSDCKRLADETKRYRYKEGSDMPEKGNDHGVDAATAFYATRAKSLLGNRV